jgi:hypothetical protein
MPGAKNAALSNALGWCKGNSSQIDITTCKQTGDFSLLDPPNVRVPGIVYVIIVSEDQSVSPHHTQHLRSNLLFHPGSRIEVKTVD